MWVQDTDRKLKWCPLSTLAPCDDVWGNWGSLLSRVKTCAAERTHCCAYDKTFQLIWMKNIYLKNKLEQYSTRTKKSPSGSDAMMIQSVKIKSWRKKKKKKEEENRGRRKKHHIQQWPIIVIQIIWNTRNRKGGGGQLSWYKLPKLIRYNKTQTHSFKQV